MSNQRICSIEGCGNKHSAFGVCQTHRHRWIKHGDVLADIPIARKDKSAMAFLDEARMYNGDNCLIWPFSRLNNGYATVTIDGVRSLVSRIICEHKMGAAPIGKTDAAHSCGNGHLGCIAASHLRWATHAENMAEMVEHGRSTRGEKAWFNKLSEPQIAEIRERLRAGERQRIIADHFGITQSNVSKIKTGISWNWLND